jgi:hypothetical protein
VNDVSSQGIIVIVKVEVIEIVGWSTNIIVTVAVWVPTVLGFAVYRLIIPEVESIVSSTVLRSSIDVESFVLAIEY